MKKIMVVDDALFMRQMLKGMLQRNGFEVVGEAENGSVALEKYKTLKPDLVTMDITMPEMGGILAIKKLREIDTNCKIVVISALGQEFMVREAVISGAKGFVVKPFREKDVVASINRVLAC